jgi:hypothetical protein
MHCSCHQLCIAVAQVNSASAKPERPLHLQCLLVLRLPWYYTRLHAHQITSDADLAQAVVVPHLYLSGNALPCYNHVAEALN